MIDSIAFMSVMPKPYCATSWITLGISATTINSAAAPNRALGLLRPRLIACFSQDQPAPGPIARVVISIPRVRARHRAAIGGHRTRRVLRVLCGAFAGAGAGAGTWLSPPLEKGAGACAAGDGGFAFRAGAGCVTRK